MFKTVCPSAWVAPALASVVLAGGCGSEDTGREKTYQVTGKVTLDGEPVAGAAVTFLPNGPGNSASGVTDDQGSYNLSTFSGNDGARPGDYTVKVVKYESAGGRLAEANSAQAAAGGYPTGYRGAASRVGSRSKNILPDKYSEPATSGLNIAVAPNNENIFDIALESTADPR